MTIAWFITSIIVHGPNMTRKHPITKKWITVATRRPLLAMFDEKIRDAKGAWQGTEVLGGNIIIKVRAPEALLTEIANTEGIFRVPIEKLDNTLGSLDQPKLLAIRDKILGMGYTTEELNSKLPDDWRSVTLRQVLEFAATRTIAPRFDSNTDSVTFSGPQRKCTPISKIDAAIKDDSPIRSAK